VAPGAPRSTAAQIEPYLAGLGSVLDVDGVGGPDALTDGLLIIRYLFGLRGAPLTAGAVAPGATRYSAPDIEAYIKSLMP